MALQLRRGLFADLPVLALAELVFCEDNKRLYIGSVEGNIDLGTVDIEESTTNGSIIVNGVEMSVYDEQAVLEAVGAKVDKVVGKGLSTNDYTKDDKDKLNRLSVDVNGDLLIDNIRVTDKASIGGTTEPVDTTAPLDVQNLTVSGVTYNTAELRWSQSDTSAVGYDIFNGTTLLGSTTELVFITNALLAETTYTLTVKAKDSANNISAGTSVMFTTLAEGATDTIAPTVTASPAAGTYTTTQTVILEANETATIYYTLDGTTPTNASTVYSKALTISATSTLKCFAIDTAGNQSATYSIVYTINTAPDSSVPAEGQVTDAMVLNYDFRNKKGSASTSITDSVSGVTATMTGVVQDGVTDGYLTNQGLYLQNGDYLTIPTNTAPFSSTFDFSLGATIEIVTFDSQGILFRNDSAATKGVLLATQGMIYEQYVSSTDGTTKNTAKDFAHFQKNYPVSTINSTLADVLYRNGSEAINTIVIRYFPDLTVDMVVNGSPASAKYKPADIASFVNFFAAGAVHLHRDHVGTNTQPTKLANFSVYNKALTVDECRQNHKYHQDLEELMNVAVAPVTVSMGVGDTQKLTIVTKPPKFVDDPDLVTTFQSGNTGYVTVDEEGFLLAEFDGDTSITCTSTYATQSWVNEVVVKVSSTSLVAPASERVITGMSMNRKTDTIEIGENFVAMATALSTGLAYDIFHDNYTIWETSNPDVCRIAFGVLEGITQGTATITAWDASKTYSASFDVNVIPPVAEAAITAAETYNVVLADYTISGTNTDSTATTNGIQAALDYAAANGYKKIVFPLATYLVNPSVQTIDLPTEMVVDFSNSTVNIEKSALTATGYRMFKYENVKDAKLTRIRLFGEANQVTAAESHEKNLSLLFRGDCVNTGIEDCTFSKSPGFNVIMENVNVAVGTTQTTMPYSIFEPGTIDDLGVPDDTDTVSKFRTSVFLDISGLGEDYYIGYGYKYFGYPYLRSRLYTIHFYDSAQTYLTTQKWNLQYHTYDKPANAHYAKLVIYQEAAPTAGDIDFAGSVAFIRTIGTPRDCYMRDCVFEDNYSTGVAMCGGYNWLLEGNTFARNGLNGRVPACDIDWEDGWDCSLGDVARHNTFSSQNGVIGSGSTCTALLDNTFKRADLKVWTRTMNWRILNNAFVEKGEAGIELGTQGDSYLARNTFTGVTFTTELEHPTASYKIHESNNTLIT